jgi:hypothetical protein
MCLKKRRFQWRKEVHTGEMNLKAERTQYAFFSSCKASWGSSTRRTGRGRSVSAAESIWCQFHETFLAEKFFNGQILVQTLYAELYFTILLSEASSLTHFVTAYPKPWKKRQRYTKLITTCSN